MKKEIIPMKIQVKMKGFVPPFFNYFSLGPNRKKLVIMRARRKKLNILTFSCRFITY